MKEREEKSNCCSTRLVLCVTLVVVLALSVPVIIFNLKEMFSVTEIKVGILDINDSENTFEKMAFNVVEILNLNDPRVKVSLYRRNTTAEPVAGVFRSLYGAGVRVFLLSDRVTTGDQREIEMQGEEAENCIFLSKSGVRPGSGLSVLSLQPDQVSLARAHLSLINSTGGPGGATIVPVMRDDPAASQLYRAVIAEAKQLPNLRLVNPVVYSRTEHSRSDGFQVVNRLGQLILTHPEADIFLLTSELLPDILAVTHLNPSLARRSWWAVGAAGLGVRLRAGGRARRQLEAAKLSTLSYLGTDSVQEETARQRYLQAAGDTQSVSGSLYDQWLLYSRLSALTGAGDVPQTDGTDSRLFVSLTLDTEHVSILPSFPWSFESILTVNSGNVTQEKLTSVRLGNVSKSLNLKCDQPAIEVNVPGQSFLPEISRLVKGREQDSLVVPAVEGSRLTFSCEEEEYVCSPPEPLSCQVVRRGAGGRARRGLGRETDYQAVGGFLTHVNTELGKVRESWSALLPNIVSCFASVAGN